MLVLELHNPHWLFSEKPELDLCAHGSVEVRVNGIVFSDRDSGNWTISASALYLLRTITQDHTKENPVCEHLIPCCGFCMYDQGEGKDVILFGCPNGIDFEVRHQGDQVILTKQEKEETSITLNEWRQAVFKFADVV